MSNQANVLLTAVATTVSMTDASFKNVASTPFKIYKSLSPIPPDQYAVYRFEVALPGNVTTGISLTYITNLEVFGIQSEGSGADTDKARPGRAIILDCWIRARVDRLR